ncbi:MAG: KH domain-containing protein [Eubacterium sp.]|nr:KH domain-containing protein [Eubacterium sp.]
MTNLVEMIAKSLVDNPQEVQVSESAGDAGVVITLQVSKDDMGKVIGKQGRIARALRTVVKAAAIKSNKKVTVDIVSEQLPEACDETTEERSEIL